MANYFCIRPKKNSALPLAADEIVVMIEGRVKIFFLKFLLLYHNISCNITQQLIKNKLTCYNTHKNKSKNAAVLQTRRTVNSSFRGTLKTNEKLHEYFWRSNKNFRNVVFFLGTDGKKNTWIFTALSVHEAFIQYTDTWTRRLVFLSQQAWYDKSRTWGDHLQPRQTSAI